MGAAAVLGGFVLLGLGCFAATVRDARAGNARLQSIYSGLRLGMSQAEASSLIQSNGADDLNVRWGDDSAECYVRIKSAVASNIGGQWCLRVGLADQRVDSYAMFSSDDGDLIDRFEPAGRLPEWLAKAQEQ